MAGLGRKSGALCAAVLLGVVLLLAIPPTTALPVRSTAAPPGVPSSPATPPGPAAATTTAPSVAPPTAASGGAHPTGLSRGAIHLGSPFAAAGGPSGTPAVPAAKKGPGYIWGSAYVFYAPSDPSSLLFGQGTGLAVDNALDEFAFFGGLATGGLSAVTLRYYWWYNASDPANSSEGWGYTNSTQSPSARTNMSMAGYQAGGVALLFGGLTNTATQSTTNDTWLYDFAADNWTNVSARDGPGAAAPPPREEAALAVDETDGIALLFGGIAPEYTSGGSTGSVIWQDTWIFHFRTGQWTELFPGAVPPGRYGASMVWDSVDDEFLMVGGCALTCSMDAWAFRPATMDWTNLSQTGAIPTPRGSASFAWDPTSDDAVLYGGVFHDSQGNAIDDGDSYVFHASGVWTALNASAVGPAPIYRAPPFSDAETVWANFPDCDVMFMAGGDEALTSITSMVYDIIPTTDSSPVQCWPTYDVPQPPSYVPPPCSHETQLVISVVSSVRLKPIAGATVAVNGTCGTVIVRTDGTGNAFITIATPDNLSLAVSAPNFHDNSTWYNYTYTNVTLNQSGGYITQYDTVWLVPFPSIDVQVLANDGGIYLSPLAGATVALDNSSVIGITDAAGWANESAVSVFNRTATVEATDDNYSTAWRFVYLGYTGEVESSLELLKAGRFTVVVLDERSGDPIGDAHGLVTHLDPGLPAPFGFTTDASGKFSRLLVAGNYSVAAWASGYLNGTTASGDIKWVSNLTLTLKLTPNEGTNASVRLVDSQTGEPIAYGTVSFGDVRVAHTNAQGWANVTDLLPPGPMRVTGSASGYRSNNTTVVLRYNYVLPPVVMKLQCLACVVGGPGGSGGLAASPFLPTSGAGLLLLLIAPALLAVGGAVYVIAATARRRPSEGGAPGRSGRLPAMAEAKSP